MGTCKSISDLQGRPGAAQEAHQNFGDEPALAESTTWKLLIPYSSGLPVEQGRVPSLFFYYDSSRPYFHLCVSFAFPIFLVPAYSPPAFNMAPSAVDTTPQHILEKEDKARDAAFNKSLHGKSAEVRGGFAAMRSKDAAAQKAAVDEYFKHWDDKLAATETEEVRKARRDEYATLTRQYVENRTCSVAHHANMS